MRLSNIKHHDDRGIISAKERFEKAQKMKTFKTYVLVEVIAVTLITYLVTNLN